MEPHIYWSSAAVPTVMGWGNLMYGEMETSLVMENVDRSDVTLPASSSSSCDPPPPCEDVMVLR